VGFAMALAEIEEQLHVRRSMNKIHDDYAELGQILVRGWNMKEWQKASTAAEAIAAPTVVAQRGRLEQTSNIPSLQISFQLAVQEGQWLRKSRLEGIELIAQERLHKHTEAEVRSVLSELIYKVTNADLCLIYPEVDEDREDLSERNLLMCVPTEKDRVEVTKEADKLIERLRNKQLSCVDWLYIQSETSLGLVANDSTNINNEFFSRSNDRVAFIEKNNKMVGNTAQVKKDPFIVNIQLEPFSLFGDTTKAFMNQKQVLEQQGMYENMKFKTNCLFFLCETFYLIIIS